MKIQSRPPEKLKSDMTVLEMTSYLRNILEIEGYNEGSMYRKVLVLGALAMLNQIGVITDYQARIESCGYYNVWVQVRTTDGMCETLEL